jgi:hypothetical protein
MTTAPVDQLAGLRKLRDRVAIPLESGFARIDRVLAHKRAWIAAVTFVFALQIVLVALHRPWLDELQALQLAVQSPGLSSLLANLRYEGHPPLWYLILRGLAALFDDPVRALPAAALVMAIAVQALILFVAPFSRAERLMIALSEFVLFEFLTVSRSLTLGVAVMIMVAATWRQRRCVWVLIALLPLTDFLFGVVSLLLVGLRARERRLYWPGVGLWVASGLLAAWSVRPMPDITSSLLPTGPFHDLALWMANFATLGLPLQWNTGGLQWNSPPPPGFGGPALLGLLVMAWAELRKRPDYLCAFMAFVVLTLVFSMTAYQLSIRHLAIAVALLIALVWLKTDNGARLGAARTVWWRTWLLVASLCGLLTAAINLVEPFDRTPEAAGLINRLGLHDKVWVPFPHSAGQGVAALNGMMFERLGEHCSEDFVRWNAADDHLITNSTALTARLTRKVAQDGRFYLLSWFKLPDHPPLLRRLGVVPHGYDGQDFVLYVVGEDRPDARPHGQPCASPHPALRRTF